MPFTPQVRLLLLVLVLACAAAGATLLMVNRGRESSSGEQSSVTVLRQTSTPSAQTPAARKPTRPKVAPAQPAPRDQLPVAIRRELDAGEVVVVALYDPEATIDGTALREARAGARRAGTPFVPVDVRTNKVYSLNAKYGVTHDPAVLVLRPPGDLVVRIDGFADRDTVAQAAVNAGP